MVISGRFVKQYSIWRISKIHNLDRYEMEKRFLENQMLKHIKSEEQRKEQLEKIIKERRERKKVVDGGVGVGVGVSFE